MAGRKVRIGVLGAARIAPFAIFKPSSQVNDVEVTSIAARDPARAAAYARKYGIPKVASSYEALIDDPDVDAIYNPLPNSLHAEWTLRAIAAKKHVLCEKPFTSNEREAQRVADAARGTGLVVMEAFHWRYHPLAHRMRAIVDSGELGKIHRIETTLCIPMPLPNDIRYRLDLSGGAMMDTGCYTVSMLRHLAGAEPTVVKAEAKLARPGVDRSMQAEFTFEDGRTGAISCSLFSTTLLSVRARVEGDQGVMNVFNPIMPQVYHQLTVGTRHGRRNESFEKTGTYTYQLRAFVHAILRGEPYPTTADDAVLNMHVIDSVYRAAGLPIRGTTS